MQIRIELKNPEIVVHCEAAADAAYILRALRDGRPVEQVEVLAETEPDERDEVEPEETPAPAPAVERRTGPAPIIYQPPPERPPLRAVPPPAPPASTAEPERRAPLPVKPTPAPMKQLLNERNGNPSDMERKPMISAVIIEAYRRNTSFPQHELAKKIYGDSTADSMRKLKLNITQLCARGKLYRLGAGSYRPRDEKGAGEQSDEEAADA